MSGPRLRADGKGCRCFAAAILIACLAWYPAMASEKEVPLLEPELAWRLTAAPVVRMIDGTTCEWIGAVWNRLKRQLSGAGVTLALFRRSGRRPFMHAHTREDSVVVARFPARPGETIIAKAEGRDSKTGRVLGYGSPMQAVCLPTGNVSTGELVPVTEEASKDEERRETVP